MDRGTHFALLPCCIAAATLSNAQVADFLPVAGTPRIQSPAVAEASGIAVSSANPDFIWLINDSGGTPDLHLAGTDGSDRGKVTLIGAENTDWEDLASFSFEGKSHLLVADTGDNGSRRETCTLLILREPALPAAGGKLAGTAQTAWRIQFKYEGGPRDCEAVAVDAQAGKILLNTKRTDPPEVHELPLRPPGNRGTLTTRRIGLTAVKSPLDSLIPFRDQPTGLSINADGSLAAVITYYGVFLFPRRPEESWADAFAKKPVALPPHLLSQAEGVAFSNDGKAIHAISEGKNPPIRTYRQ